MTGRECGQWGVAGRAPVLEQCDIVIGGRVLGQVIARPLIGESRQWTVGEECVA